MTASNKSQFIQLIQHPVKFRMFLFSKLPSAFFSGVRVNHIDETKTIVSVPYKWFSQNPFKSTYFACLAMAGRNEYRTFGDDAYHKISPAISMLVVGLEAKYFKKATSPTLFTCEDGGAISNTITDSINTVKAGLLKQSQLGETLMVK
jgi:hypothetical protein